MLKIKPNLEAIIWDFDGVLLDSNKVRDLGFKEVLKEYKPEDVAKLLDFHQANGGLSRYVKFEYFFAKVLQIDYSDDDIQRLAEAFSEIMKRLLTNKELLITETVNFIKAHFEQLPMHIVSGSDGQELRYLCNKLDLTKFFKSIDGSPTPKVENVKLVIEEFKYDPDNLVLVGDSINDYEAAVDSDILFFAYNNSSLEHLTSY